MMDSDKKPLAKRPKPPAQKRRKLSAPVTACFVCGQDGADEVVSCSRSRCGKIYHLACLKLTDRPQDGWLCIRHYCQVCSEAATMMCTLCPVSYCDQHAIGHTILGSVFIDGRRVRQRMCTAHSNTPTNSGKARRRRSSKLKAGLAAGLEDEEKTEAEIQAADMRTTDGMADASSAMEETNGTSESVAELPMSAQNGGNDGHVDTAEVAGLQEPETLNSRPMQMASQTSPDHEKLNSKPMQMATPTSPDHEQRLCVKPTPRQKLLAAQLLKRNGISMDVVEMGSLGSFLEKRNFQPVNDEKPNRAAPESVELTSSTEKKPGKRTPVVNGYHMSTRRRSSLQETSLTPKMSQSLNSKEKETPVNGIVTNTVTALLDETSELENLELLKCNEVAVDGN